MNEKERTSSHAPCAHAWGTPLVWQRQWNRLQEIVLRFRSCERCGAREWVPMSTTTPSPSP